MGSLKALVIGLAMVAVTSLDAGAQQVAADDEQRFALAREIIQLRTDDASDMTMLQAKMPFFSASVAAAAHLTEAERAALPSLIEQAYRAVRAPVREQVAVTYAHIFTLSQLQQLLAFYRSDAGQAFLTHQQELTTASVNLQRLSDAAVVSSVVRAIEDRRRSGSQ